MFDDSPTLDFNVLALVHEMIKTGKSCVIEQFAFIDIGDDS